MTTIPVPAGNTGDSGNQPDPTPVTTPTPAPEPTPTPAPVAPTAKFEVVEGKVQVDGKKFVPESDLIAAKNSLEGKMTTQQTAHETAINAAKLAESEGLKTIATLNAKITENEQARQAGAVTDEAAAKNKTDLDAALASIETLTSGALEMRRANLVLQYGVNADTIKEKSLAELNAFEEALKAVGTARNAGIGPYVVGGGSGVPVAQTNIERAAAVIAATPQRGVREPTKQ